MRLNIIIRNVNLLENVISVSALLQNHKGQSINSGSHCLWTLSDQSYEGKVSSLHETKSSKSILLHFPREQAGFDLVKELFYIQYTGSSYPLFIEEKADLELFKETGSLLEAVSIQSGKQMGEILNEITSFKPGIPGKTDLRYVSAKQMKVVRDKLLEITKERG